MSVYENHRNAFRCTRSTRLHYFAHRHREIELVFMLNGQSKAIVNGVPHELKKGDALIVFPNQLHQYISTCAEDYILLLIPSTIYGEYAESIDGHLPIHPIIPGGACNKEVLTLANMCLDSKHPFAYQCKKFLIGAILGTVLKDLPLKKDKSHTDKTALERILAYCERHYTESISLASMSRELFLSKFYISRLFNEQLGISFCNYISSLRIEESVKMLLSTNLSITEICFATGFASTRTFNRVFRNRIGISPKEYRESQQNLPASYPETVKRQSRRK